MVEKAKNENTVTEVTEDSMQEAALSILPAEPVDNPEALNHNGLFVKEPEQSCQLSEEMLSSSNIQIDAPEIVKMVRLLSSNIRFNNFNVGL